MMLASYAWWMTTITLTTMAASVVALCIFVVLVAVRYWYEDLRRKQERRREELKRDLLVSINHPLRDVRALCLQNKRDIVLLAEVVPPLVRLLKGDSLARLRETLRVLGLYDFAWDKVKSFRVSYKLAAIRLLSSSENEQVNVCLFDMLRHRNFTIRREAADLLASRGDVRYLPSIIACFYRDDLFSAPLMQSIFHQFGAEAEKPLTTLLKTRATPVRMRNAALSALARICSPSRIIEIVQPLCWHPDSSVRIQAFQTLVDAGCPLPSALLAQGAGDVEWRVRRAVACAAAHAVPFPVEVLNALLRDTHWLVGMQAMQTLQQSGQPGVALLHAAARQSGIAAIRASRGLLEYLPERPSFAQEVTHAAA